MPVNASPGAAAAVGCRVGRHHPKGRVTTDASGLQHSRCRHCGCALSRVPTIGRWYLSGELG